jgi:hypothetical protein
MSNNPSRQRKAESQCFVFVTRKQNSHFFVEWRRDNASCCHRENTRVQNNIIKCLLSKRDAYQERIEVLTALSQRRRHKSAYTL